MDDLLTRTVADVLQLRAEQVSDNLEMSECPAWDSLRHFHLVVTIEQVFGVRFLSTAIPELTSVGRIRHEVQRLKGRSS